MTTILATPISPEKRQEMERALVCGYQPDALAPKDMTAFRFSESCPCWDHNRLKRVSWTLGGIPWWEWNGY